MSTIVNEMKIFTGFRCFLLQAINQMIGSFPGIYGIFGFEFHQHTYCQVFKKSSM